jgi:hypothetical protein
VPGIQSGKAECGDAKPVVMTRAVNNLSTKMYKCMLCYIDALSVLKSRIPKMLDLPCEPGLTCSAITVPTPQSHVSKVSL